MSIQSIRDNSQSMLAKIIVGAIVVTFALFGADAIIGYSSNSNQVAEVNGEEISAPELARATEMLKRQVLDRMGENADPSLIDDKLIRSRALDSLVERQMLMQDAKQLGIYTATAKVDTLIAATPAFQVDGLFNQQVYEATVRNIGLLPREYRTQLAFDLQLQQPQSAITLSSFMTATEAKNLADLDRQLRNLAFVRVTAEELAQKVVIAPDAANQYYADNQSSFMTEEQVQLEYLELKRGDFAADVAVTEGELRQLYEQEVERYKGREERKAAHILIEVGAKNDRDSAKAKIEEVLAKLDAGEDFAALAKTYSEDPGSAEAGGDLGYAQRGAYVEAFENALFALNVGETSPIIETEFGFHLIRLTDARTPEVPAFDDLTLQLEADLRFQKSEELFVEQADRLQNDSFSAGDLGEPAERLGLPIQTTQFFTRAGGEGIAQSAKLVSIAFSDEVLTEGHNSDLIEISKDHVVVVRLKAHQAAEVKPYDQVASQVKDMLTLQEAALQAQKLGEQLLIELREGKTPEQITSDYGYEWTIHDKVSRNQEDLDAELNETLFKMPKPPVGEKTLQGIALKNGDFAVLALTKVYEGGTTDLNPKETEALQRLLAGQFGRYDYQDYVLNLKRTAQIEKY